jgi:hypothetical protein
MVTSPFEREKFCSIGLLIWRFSLVESSHPKTNIPTAPESLLGITEVFHVTVSFEPTVHTTPAVG